MSIIPRRVPLVNAVLAAIVATGCAWRAAGADGDWPLHGLDYANTRHSPFAQIDRDAVAGLARRWVYRTGIAATFQATPIVVDGTMYLSTPFNDVVALDAATGTERWRYHHALRSKELCCGPANRGVAVTRGLALMATVDARLVALDSVSGAVRWDVPIADTDQGAMEQLAPLLGVSELALVQRPG